MINTDIKSFLPPVLLKMREFKGIAEAEDTAFNKKWEELSEMLKNFFIVSCDERGISDFERMLKIKSAEGDNLETRINRVLIKWNNSSLYVLTVLLERLDSVCGKDNYTVDIKYSDYEIKVTVHFEDTGQIKEIKNMLTEMIPANMVIIINNRLEYSLRIYPLYMKRLGISAGYSVIDMSERMYFDGTWKFDGSRTFYRESFIKACLKVFSDYKVAAEYAGQLRAYMNNPVQMNAFKFVGVIKTRTDTNTGKHIGYERNLKNFIKSEPEVKHNACLFKDKRFFFNSTWRFDGSRKFNSEILKEEL